MAPQNPLLAHPLPWSDGVVTGLIRQLPCLDSQADWQITV